MRVFPVIALAAAMALGLSHPVPADTESDPGAEAAAARAAAEEAASRCADAEKRAADLRLRLAATEESTAALRELARNREREATAAIRERDALARRLEQALARLASTTQAAAASDSQLATLVDQSRKDSARVQSLEAQVETLMKALARAEADAATPRAEAANPAPANASLRDYEAALDARTRENLELKTRVGQLETRLYDLSQPGAPAAPLRPAADAAPAASITADRDRMNALFEDEKKTLLLVQTTTEEHLAEARIELQGARKRIADLERALAKRGTLEAEILTLGSDLDTARREARDAHERASAIARDKAATTAEVERLRAALAEAEREIESLRARIKAAGGGSRG